MAKIQPTSKVRDVMKVFWTSSKANIWQLIALIICYVTASVIQVIVPLYYKGFFDLLNSGTNKAILAPQLTHTIVIIFSINIFSWLSYRGGAFFLNSFESKTIANLKQRSFDYLIGHSYSFFSDNFTGSLVQRVGRMSRAFERLTDRFAFSIIPLTVSITGISIVLWQVYPPITIGILIWIFTFGSFNYGFSRFKLKYDIELADIDSATTGLLADNITNHNAIQTFVTKDEESTRFRDATNKQGRMMRFVWNMSAVIDAVQSSLIFLVEFLLFYFAIKYWQQGIITVGTFILIQIYFINLGTKLWDFSRIVRDLHEGFADAKEMTDIILMPHSVRNIPTATELMVTNGEVSFDKVLFSFNNTRTVLNELSTHIPGGQKVALIGPSGAGKSTFVRLLLRLYDVTGGMIAIDGQNIKDVTQESLRQHISLVPQDPVLFHRSLMENIRYGKSHATDEEVFAAAKLAHCDEFISGLPLGYKTLVGERGIKLSGGERQRIAIARAILKNAPILILDEATSSLDSESESLIQDALQTLMKGKTSIVIAHRLSTIRTMDRIIVIDGGKIVEDGNHEDLLQQPSSLYARLWSLQAGGFIAE